MALQVNSTKHLKRDIPHLTTSLTFNETNRYRHHTKGKLWTVMNIFGKLMISQNIQDHVNIQGRKNFVDTA